MIDFEQVDIDGKPILVQCSCHKNQSLGTLA